MYKIPAKTLFIGKNLVYVPECHSTNSLALELSQQPSTPDGTVVITDCQTAGRGQRGNSWEAEPGKNLTFSLLIKPLFLAIKDQFLLNIFISLAIHDFLQYKTNADISIKWPNDLLLNNKKVCGILIENHIRGAQVSTTVVGVGLNINQSKFSHPDATSLYQVLYREEDLSSILADLLGYVEARYLQLRQGNIALLKEEYLNNLYWRNAKHLFKTNDYSFEGTIIGIHETGKLAVDTAEGLKYFDVKEIRYLQ